MADLRETRREQMFPVLTAAQLARLEAFGKRLALRAGTVLAEPGERFGGAVVVLSGALEVLRPDIAGDQLLTVHAAGQFAGEISSLRGAGGFVRVRVRDDAEVIALDHEGLLRLMQGDSELSELFMRAFILRRLGLLQNSKQGDVILLGSSHSAGTLRVQQFLGRNGFPHVYIDVDHDADVADFLERFQVAVEDVPVVICRGQVLKNPGNAVLAECLNMNAPLDECEVRDVVVIGAGPAGLAAAVYAASEGLSVLVLETTAAGGQAGSSSKIENYLGFPTGISGGALAGRAMTQAQKFGAEVAVASSAVRLGCEARPYTVELSDGRVVRARTIVIATGAEYRQLALDNLASFVGAGVYYAATHIEAKVCRGEEVVVVGGGNSAGQAAVFLAADCQHVNIVVRGAGLAETMSRYLINRIQESRAIELHTHTEIAALEGDGRLERVTWRCATSGEVVTEDIRHLFLMTGAVPNTGWLDGCLALDEKGFIRTGTDLRAEDLAASAWPLARPPHLLETSLPGVFAVGDVRAGSMKRVAAAVGEGSACVQLVHRALGE
jgi:thioredoxin reductase (NADPH)